MRLFSEIKSNLTEDEVKNLTEAGFYKLQPGIESLSDVVLKLMNKGNTAINHIALLKYAQKHSVFLLWNFMYGFPGEYFETYEELCELMPLIYHLPAPTGGVQVAYHRNSVYCDNPEKYSLKLTPSPVYDYFAPDDQEFINDYAYFFEDHSENEEKRKHPVYKKFNDSISHWINVYYNGNARLDMIVFEDRIKIFDTREIRVKSRYELTELSREIYLLCSSPKSYKTITETFTESYGKDEIDSCLTELENLKLLLRIKDEFLSLAVERPQEFLFSLLFMNAG